MVGDSFRVRPAPVRESALFKFLPSRVLALSDFMHLQRRRTGL